MQTGLQMCADKIQRHRHVYADKTLIVYHFLYKTAFFARICISPVNIVKLSIEYNSGDDQVFVKNGTGRLKRVLMSPPSYLEARPINEIANQYVGIPFDKKKMAAEYASLKKIYRGEGIQIEELPADPERPNCVFARDFGGCIREGYILGRYAIAIRKKETGDYKAKLEELGVPLVCQVQEGHFEGGDFIFLDEHTLAVGMVARTDRKGIEEIRDAVTPLGYEVIAVPADSRYLHVDLLFNLIDDHLALAYRPGLPEEFLREVEKRDIEMIDVPDTYIMHLGSNVQAIGDKKVVALASNHAVNRLMEKHGMTVLEADITEICKSGGGPHCMTFPLSRE